VIFGCLPEQLAAHAGCSEPEARRVMAHVLARGHRSLDGMKRPVAKPLRPVLEALIPAPLRVVAQVTDPVDRSVRVLFELADGAQVEAVRIPLAKPDRFTVCLSSQVGCAMRCAFCATGRLGLTRNLTAAEMVACWMAVRDDAPGTVTGAVFMGQGEPLHNYDAVIQAARVLSHPCGGRIAAKAITISTVGLVPQIHRYAAEGHAFRLIVSLTSAVQSTRDALLPVAGRWSLVELAAALRAVNRATGKPVTLAWVLIGGVNHDDAQLAALEELVADLPVRINLIDVNDTTDQFRRASPAERDRFVDGLAALGVPFVRRYSVGAEQNSACGMLSSRAPDAPASGPASP
jgi:23S rRNA (adenine2503-C2)-methyltransferase